MCVSSLGGANSLCTVDGASCLLCAISITLP